MKIFLLLMLGIVFFSSNAQAELIYQGGYNPNLSFEQYTEAAYPKPQRSIIYIFTSNAQCTGCQQAANLIQQIYDDTYTNVYDLQAINYDTDQEYNYIQAYQLDKPFEVVLVKAADGEALGYKKLDNLQNMVSDPISFKDNFEYQINSYLED